MKRLAIALILSVVVLSIVSCSGQRKAYGGPCKGSSGMVGYGRQ
jgi:hypothetical protein